MDDGRMPAAAWERLMEMSQSNISVGTNRRIDELCDLVNKAWQDAKTAPLELRRLERIGRKNGWPMPWEPGFEERFGVKPAFPLNPNIPAPLRPLDVPKKVNPVVYFIKAKTLNLIKIGTSRDAVARLSLLQVGSPDRLEIIKTIPGDQSRETALHEKFRHLHSHGEWFRATDELLAFIEGAS
jgi:hypothetical protein